MWLKSVRQLAIGLATVTNILSPEAIVLGGGITEAGADLFNPLENYLASYEWRAGGNGWKQKARHGDLAGGNRCRLFRDGQNLNMSLTATYPQKCRNIIETIEAQQA